MRWMIATGKSSHTLAFPPERYVFLPFCSVYRDYWAGPLCQLFFQQPLDSYRGRECEIIFHHGECPLVLSHAPLQHLISTLLMPCVPTETLCRQRETDGERVESAQHAHIYQVTVTLTNKQCFINGTLTQPFTIISIHNSNVSTESLRCLWVTQQRWSIDTEDAYRCFLHFITLFWVAFKMRDARRAMHLR